MKNIVFLASGNGSNFQAVADAIDSGFIDARISKLICNNKNGFVLQRAKNMGIESILINSKNDYNNLIYIILKEENPDLIVLDGYMKILSENIINEFVYKIINLHPSLLPAFGGKGYYGKIVHENVIASGARYSGCTLHFATNDVDNGPIIDQRVVEVLDDDTPESLEEKIHKVEHESLIFSINLVLNKIYEISGKRVKRL